ncbi:3-dehydrosphinganine reductase [Dimargaris xerosporica]|nr:3-dehydrosphinganine reductase [Dimargaris xerosporica]
MDSWSSCLTTTATLAGAYLAWYAVCAWQCRRAMPALCLRGSHCYVTGGSAGLGEHLANLLAEAGANVTIVARNQARLSAAQKRIQSHCVDPEQQRIVAISADVADAAESARALHQAIKAQRGQVPQYVFACAGLTTPRFFLEYQPQDFEQTMQVNYFGALHTIQEAAKLMIKHEIKGGRVVTVSSQAGLLGIPGYSEYTPSKAALRMLAETLYYELAIYGIAAHCFLPANIRTPGFEHENQTKPEITRIIDGDDEAMDPRECAQCLLDGMAKGYPSITSDWLGDIVRATCRGVGPANNMALDTLFVFLGWFLVPLWRMIVWWQAKSCRQTEAALRKQVLSQ